MKTQIISIGNELLIGDTVNTNASWMANLLTETGFEVTKIITIPDDKKIIQQTVSEAMSVSDVVFCTGGLGPTHDDTTKTAVAELFNAQMKRDEKVLQFVESRMKKMNISMSESNKDQALVPQNCEVLFNTQGSAPGMWFCENNSYLAVLPGVPSEMKYLMKERVLPKLQQVFGDIEFLNSTYIHTAGVGESTLSEDILGDLSGYLNDEVSLAFLPFAGGVTLRLNSKGSNKDDAVKKAKTLYDHIYEKAGIYIYGEGKDARLSEVVGKILKSKSLMLAASESCTGGLLSDEITNISGSAEYFQGGIIAYDNQVKIDLLNVDKDDIARYGAVSKEVALQMAKGVAERLKADIGVSTTGIAGPTGGTEEKPVGTVWIGFYSSEEHFAVKATFSTSRRENKKRTVVSALEIIRRVLLGLDEMPYSLKKQNS